MLSLLTENETDKKCSISAIARLKTVDTWKSNITFFGSFDRMCILYITQIGSNSYIPFRVTFANK